MLRVTRRSGEQLFLALLHFDVEVLGLVFLAVLAR